MIICKIIVHLLVTVQNNKKIKINTKYPPPQKKDAPSVASSFCILVVGIYKERGTALSNERDNLLSDSQTAWNWDVFVINNRLKECNNDFFFNVGHPNVFI